LLEYEGLNTAIVKREHAGQDRIDGSELDSDNVAVNPGGDVELEFQKPPELAPPPPPPPLLTKKRPVIVGRAPTVFVASI